MGVAVVAPPREFCEGRLLGFFSSHLRSGSHQPLPFGSNGGHEPIDQLVPDGLWAGDRRSGDIWVHSCQHCPHFLRRKVTPGIGDLHPTPRKFPTYNASLHELSPPVGLSAAVGWAAAVSPKSVSVFAATPALCYGPAGFPLAEAGVFSADFLLRSAAFLRASS